jgi:hypothetical protein
MVSAFRTHPIVIASDRSFGGQYYRNSGIIRTTPRSTSTWALAGGLEPFTLLPGQAVDLTLH